MGANIRLSNRQIKRSTKMCSNVLNVFEVTKKKYNNSN